MQAASLSFGSVVEHGDDFDDPHDELSPGPLLPAEDRLWRHPSELGGQSSPIVVEALAARRRWLASTPSSVGAWSAGIVGAVLATGVVLAGVYLTHWLSPAPGAAAHTSLMTPNSAPGTLQQGSTSTVVTTATDPVTRTTTTTSTSTSVAWSTIPLERPAELTATKMAVVDAVRFGRDVRGAGVVVRSSGMVLVPASLVRGASGITVVFEGQELVGTPVGSDAGTGLALLRVSPPAGLPVAHLASGRHATVGSLVAVVWLEHNVIHACLGDIAAVNTQLASAGAPPLLESVQTFAPLPATSTGAAVIDGTGSLIGFVTGIRGSSAVTTPSWLAGIVAGDLIATGRVSHGWLGISGVPVSVTAGSGAVQGVKVLKVSAGGAAAKAGVKPGDVIDAVNGTAVTSMPDVLGVLYSMPPNSPVTLGVIREGHFFRAHGRLAAEG